MTLNESLLYEEEGKKEREREEAWRECCSRGDSRTLGSGRKHVNKATLKCIGSEMSWRGWASREEGRRGKSGRKEGKERSYPSVDRKKEKRASAWRSLSLSLSSSSRPRPPVPRKKGAVVSTRFSEIKPGRRRGSSARTRARAEPVFSPPLSLSLYGRQKKESLSGGEVSFTARSNFPLVIKSPREIPK